MPLQYRSNDVLIEVFSDLFGKSEVKVNGQSKSVTRKTGKTEHLITVTEAGADVTYRITRFLDIALGPVIDILRNGAPVLVAQPVSDLKGSGAMSKEEVADLQEKIRRKIVRSRSRAFLADYELKDAEAYLLEDAKLDPHFAETHFLLACVYSMTERAAPSLAALERAVELDRDLLNDALMAEGLAYTRLQEGFADFRSRHYLK